MFAKQCSESSEDVTSLLMGCCGGIMCAKQCLKSSEDVTSLQMYFGVTL